jgi:Fe-S-cluster containining protein
VSAPFARTSCACAECVACCKRQPGPLAPGDFEAIAEFLHVEPAELKKKLWASPGAKVMDRSTGRIFSIGSITPRFERKRCVFLDEHDRCSIHPVAPAGCSLFDTHQNAAEGLRRGSWLAGEQQDPEYQALRSTLPFATSYKPTGYK